MIRRAIGHYNTLSENRSQGEQAVYAEFGRRLQARMIQLGWNQSELSRRATAYLPKAAKGQVQGHTLGRDRISSYVRGKYLPRPDALDAIAKALQCKPADLLPPGGVPSVIEEGPMMEMKSLDGKRVAIRLNRVVSQKTATAIMGLLNQEDKL
jgi:transcriptional regulator with XRE-family HTH domain